MKHYGLNIPEGSEITNITVPSGTVDPTAAPNAGELFYRTDLSQLRIHDGTSWATIIDDGGANFVSKTGDTMTGDLTMVGSFPQISQIILDLNNISTSPGITHPSALTSGIRMNGDNSGTVILVGNTVDAFKVSSGLVVCEPELQVKAGSAADQSIIFKDNTGVGLFSGGTSSNILSVSTNNLERFQFQADGTLSAQTASYETLVTADQDIPNKKYVDDALINDPIEKTLSQPGDLVVLTGNARWYMGTNISIIDVFCSVGTAPTGSAILVDVNKNGTSILSSAVSIAAAANTSSLVVPTTTAFVVGDYITVDVDQIGSTTPGTDLVVRIKYRETS